MLLDLSSAQLMKKLLLPNRHYRETGNPVFLLFLRFRLSHALGRNDGISETKQG
jgi:hypothetical protein